ncbi:MAG: restriction endonuclease subunit S [Gammaproteobacteria bacterium]|nr:restriction endonuclease subunit S [Gammaproteobacteria bacterium]
MSFNAPLYSLKDIAIVKGGKRLPKGEPYSEVVTKYPYIRVCDFSDRTIKEGKLEYISEAIYQKIKRYTISSEDIYISIAGTIGAVGTVPETLNGANLTENAAKIVITKPDLIDRNYLVWHLSTVGQKIIESKKKATSQPKLALFRIEEIEIPLPPLKEQKRIAAILDKADVIRRKRQQAIDLTDQLLRSVFLDMFGDPVMNPKGWELVSFASVGQLDRGKSKHRPRNDPVLLGGEHPLIQTGDVAKSGGYITTYKSTYSDVGLKQSKKWPSGTLCITIAANIANTGILEFEACFPDSVVGFTPNELVTVEYIQSWLGFLQKIIEDAAPESAQKNINLAILRSLEIPLPKIEMQNKFSQIVHKIKHTKGNLVNGESEIEALFDSLTQQAFNGELSKQAKAA